MFELADHIMTSQIACCFYICMLLYGQELLLGYFKNAVWTGFDQHLSSKSLTYIHCISLVSEDGSHMNVNTKFLLFQAYSIAGKGIIAAAITLRLPNVKELHGVLKKY